MTDSFLTSSFFLTKKKSFLFLFLLIAQHTEKIHRIEGFSSYTMDSRSQFNLPAETSKLNMTERQATNSSYTFQYNDDYGQSVDDCSEMSDGSEFIDHLKNKYGYHNQCTSDNITKKTFSTVTSTATRAASENRSLNDRAVHESRFERFSSEKSIHKRKDSHHRHDSHHRLKKEKRSNHGSSSKHNDSAHSSSHHSGKKLYLFYFLLFYSLI